MGSAVAGGIAGAKGVFPLKSSKVSSVPTPLLPPELSVDFGASAVLLLDLAPPAAVGIFPGLILMMFAAILL